MKTEFVYGDYIETIEEVRVVISPDQKQVLKLIEVANGEYKEARLQIETIDETVSLTVIQELGYEELRSYMKVLQSLTKQLLTNQAKLNEIVTVPTVVI